jgi:hypothetical protein
LSGKHSQTTSAPRISLRPPAPGDEDAVAAWLGEAVAAVQGRGTAVDGALTLEALGQRWNEAYPAGETLVAQLQDGSLVGLARVRQAVRGRLVIDALTVRADARNLGYGLEMVIALEEARAGPGGTAAATRR